MQGLTEGTAPQQWASAPVEKKKRKRWPWVLLGLFVLGIGGCGASLAVLSSAANTVSDNIETAQATEAAKEAEDVTLTGCEPSTIGGMSVTGEVVNNSSKRSDYVVQIVVEQGGAQLDSTTAVVSNVEPGQTAALETGSIQGGVAGATCRITDVDRMESL